MQHLKSQFQYRKFAGESCRVLYLNDDFFMQRQSVRALKQLGHDVSVVTVQRDQTSRMLENILKAALLLKPDCVMAVNHAGFDPDGKIAALLEELTIPVLSWFLNDFRFIIRKGAVHALGNTAAFSIEKDHLALMKKAGFDHAFYLPAAASMPVMPDVSSHFDRYSHLQRAVVYVGSTFSAGRRRAADPEYAKLMGRLERLADLGDPSVDLITLVREYQGHLFRTQSEVYRYAAYVIREAMGRHRRRFLSHVKGAELHIFGEPHGTPLPNATAVYGPAERGTEVPAIYHFAGINLNVTSRQLSSGVNLRVFDVPSVGGFLLTDWRDALDELFNCANEVAAYRSVDEMNELIQYYRENPAARLKKIAAARARVDQAHQVSHRIKEMLGLGKEAFASQPQWLGSDIGAAGEAPAAS